MIITNTFENSIIGLSGELKLISQNKKYEAVFQTDGNFCVYPFNGNIKPPFQDTKFSKYCLWNTNTWGGKGKYIIMQDDGNLVIYNENRESIWSSNTCYDILYPETSKLILQDNGKIEIYTDYGLLWSNDGRRMNQTKGFKLQEGFKIYKTKIKIGEENYIKVIDYINNDNIICNLENINDIICVSYVWDEEKEYSNKNYKETYLLQEIKNTIIDKYKMKDKKFQTISKMVAICRDKDINLKKKTIWIDRYCINQDDDIEKKYLVENMGNLYKNCSCVVIASQILYFIYEIKKIFNNEKKDSKNIIKHIYEKYFRYDTRSWTFQESILNKELKFCTPDGFVNYKDIMKDIYGNNNLSFQLYLSFNLSNNYKKIPLSTIIETIIYRKSSYEEDKIYGLLGLLISKYIYYIKIEYGIGFKKVFERLVLSLNKIPHDILCLNNFNIHNFNTEDYNMKWKIVNNNIYCNKCYSNINTTYYNPFNSYIIVKSKEINIDGYISFKNKEYVNIDDFLIFLDIDLEIYYKNIKLHILKPCESYFFKKNNNHIGYIYDYVSKNFRKCFVKIKYDKLKYLKTNHFFIRDNKIKIGKYDINNNIIDRKLFIEKCIK